LITKTVTVKYTIESNNQNERNAGDLQGLIHNSLWQQKGVVSQILQSFASADSFNISQALQLTRQLFNIQSLFFAHSPSPAHLGQSE